MEFDHHTPNTVFLLYLHGFGPNRKLHVRSYCIRRRIIDVMNLHVHVLPDGVLLGSVDASVMCLRIPYFLE